MRPGGLDLRAASPRAKGLIADLVLLLVTFFWGATFVIVKEGIAAFPVLPFLFLRFGLAALLILPFVLRRVRTLDGTALRGGAAMGMWLFAGYLFQTVGLRFTSASNSGLITGLFVVLTPLLGALIARRPPAPRAAGGAGLATAGLFLLAFRDLVHTNAGDVLTLGCAASFAAHILTTDAWTRRADPAALTLVQLGVVSLLAGVLSPAFSGLPAVLPPVTVRAVVVCALFATLFAFWAQTAMQRHTTPTHTAVIFAMEPVFAVLFAYAWAGERLGPLGLLGGAVIVAGILVAEVGR